jgi:hypothetical protein
MRLSVRAARVHVEIDFFQRQRGSVWDGAIESGCTEARSHLDVESDEPHEKLVQLVRNAKRGCFAESLLAAAVPLVSRVTINGRAVEDWLDSEGHE